VKRAIRAIRQGMLLFGLDPARALATFVALPRYLKDLFVFCRQRNSASHHFGSLTIAPQLDDRGSGSGIASGHYFHQDLLVARRVYEQQPVIHCDVGSRIDGFVAHVASFREIEVFDIRLPEDTIRGIRFTVLDFTEPLPDRFRGYCDSVSSLHALEHFGLGRYGDRVDFKAHLAAIANFDALLKPGGTFYLSVPFGPQRIEFNAHRVFDLDHLLGELSAHFTLNRFSYVDDTGTLYEDVDIHPMRPDRNFDCIYGCAIFEMTKPAQGHRNDPIHA
jgi:SAM-dependent methyltransferase